MTYVIAADIGWLAPMTALAILLTGAALGAFAMGLICTNRKPAPKPNDDRDQR